MALMVPDSLPSRASQGEKTLYQVLSNKLPDDFYIWYEPIPHSQGSFPYFIILAPNFGLLILEVVGWFSQQILSADSYHFTIKSQTDEAETTEVQPSPTPMPDRRSRKRSRIITEVQPSSLQQESPLQQSNRYLNQLLDKLQTYQILCQPDGQHKSKLAFPIGIGTTLSNITINQARGKNIYNLLNEPQVIYREEFMSFHDMIQASLLTRLKRLFTNRLDFSPLTPNQIETIKGIIYPELAIKEIPAFPCSVPNCVEFRENSYVIKTLDYRQECIAKAIGEGHRIVYGVAGSGKTLILLCRAKLLAKQNPNERILILCFNISLACYLKSILHNDFQNPQFKRIDVFHFQGWGKSLGINLPVRSSGLSVDYCDELIGEILLGKLRNLPIHQKWDAVLVDEAQTFFPSWLTCCVAALKDCENGNLMLVADGNQSLYKRRGFTWKSVGIKAIGRTNNKKRNLDKNYRNTQEILAAALSVISLIKDIENPRHIDNKDDSENNFLIIEPEVAIRQGPRPVLHIQKTASQEIEAVIRQIKKLCQNNYSPSEIGVLYRIGGENERRMLDYLRKQLEHFGIEYYWVTESRSSEKSYSINKAGIRVMSTLNSLGLEFKVVLVLWVQDWEFSIPGISETDALTCRRLYVAMTRAQDLLHVFGSGNSPLLEALKRSLTFEIQQESPQTPKPDHPDRVQD